MSRISIIKARSLLSKFLRGSALLGVLASIICDNGSAAAQKPAPSPRQIDKYLYRYELMMLKPAEVLKRLRVNGEISLRTAERTFDLVLSPHDLRAPHYRAEEVTDDGISHSVKSHPVQSFKGRVSGMEGSQARFTVQEETFEGVIFTPDEWYFIEPLRHFSATALPSDMVVYRRSDIKPDALGACAATLAQQLNHGMELVAPIISENATGNLVVELATEADYEFVTALGDSANANNEILNILNHVEGVFQSELSLSFRVVYQHTWNTPFEPYTSTIPSTMLQEFSNYWNTNGIN